MSGAIELRPSPSRLLASLRLGGLALAVMAVFLLPLRPGLAWAAVGLLVLAAAWTEWRQARMMPSRIVLREDGSVELASPNGPAEVATVLPTTVVLGWLVVVHAKGLAGGRRTAIALARDSLAAEDFRRLRVWLRWRSSGRSGATAGASSP